MRNFLDPLKRFFFIITFLSSIASCGQKKKVCITVDDLPAVTYEKSSVGYTKEITERLIKTFDKYKIPAIGFVNETHLYTNGYPDSNKIEVLNIWLDNGYDLGNHTFSHLDFNKTSDTAYFADILKGELITKKLLNKHHKQIHYFRHPYLRAGMNKEKADALTKFLKAHNYEVAPVTIDTEDFLFAKAYHRASIEHNDSLMKVIGDSYLEYMEKVLVYFEKVSQEVFQRQVAQTLLIHANLLNSHYLDKLAQLYKKHGYEFVSLKEALADKAYRTEVKATPKGISWLYRWAFSKGMNESIMEGEPKVPKFIHEFAEGK